MRPIKILTDSSSDMPKKYREQYDVDCVLSSVYCNGKEIQADPDFQNVSVQDLYGSLRDGERVYTLPATENEIRTKMRLYLYQGYDVIYIAESSKLIANYDKAKKVSEELLKENPDLGIEVIDSHNTGAGITLLVLEACKLREEGKTLEEIADRLEELRSHVIEYVTTDNLDYLARAKKISVNKANIGNLLKIKPIIVFDSEGNQVMISRAKGREESLEDIVKLFLEHVESPEEQEIFLVHGDDYDTAYEVKKILDKNHAQFRKISILCAGPVGGANVGPGMIGLFGMGKEVTYKG